MTELESVRAIVYSKPRTFRVCSEPDRHPAAGEVVVRPTITGVCGTDLHIHDGGFFVSYPLIPGHEIFGVVEEVGEDVPHRVGQHVAVDNAVPCGHCSSCGRGHPLFCSSFVSLGVNAPGGVAEQVLVKAHKCFAADDIRPERGVLAEPLACVVHGMDVLQLQAGADVAVIGTGPTGLLLVQLLAHGGAGRVVLAGPTPFKLELGKAYGADVAVLVDKHAPDKTSRMLRDLAPDGYDVVVDATGAVSVIQELPSLLRNGGTAFVYGMADEDVLVAWSPYEIFRRELTIKGSFAQVNCFDRSLALLRTDRLQTDGIITHHFALDQYGDALNALRSDPSCLKTAIIP
jgi:D-arabinitol dehydrogenase (NADP+)